MPAKQDLPAVRPASAIILSVVDLPAPLRPDNPLLRPRGYEGSLVGHGILRLVARGRSAIGEIPRVSVMQ